MVIGIDARAFGWAGIGRYIQSLLAAFATSETDHTFLVLLPKTEKEKFIALSTIWPKERFQIVEVDGSYYSWREQTTFYWQLRHLPVDVMHFTHFNVPLLYRARPYVVTIHDVTRFIFPGERRQDLGQQLAYESVFANAVRHAQQIITVSNTTKEALGWLPLKIKAPMNTIYEGVAPEFNTNVPKISRQKIRLLIGTNDPYFLFVGVWMSHKNLPRLLQAFSQIVRRYPQMKLVLTGKPKPGYSNVLKLVQEYGLEKNVVFAGFVAHELLPALYAEAQACVHPSLYEGFGLPPLEAAACGTPVIAANTSSFPEILGTAALYVNPEYVPDIVRAMERIIVDEKLKHSLQLAGPKQALKYLWEKAATQHFGVYEQALTRLNKSISVQ